MTDHQLYEAIKHARLNELDRNEAIVAMMWAELFADAVMWMMNKFISAEKQATRRRITVDWASESRY